VKAVAGVRKAPEGGWNIGAVNIFYTDGRTNCGKYLNGDPIPPYIHTKLAGADTCEAGEERVRLLRAFRDGDAEATKGLTLYVYGAGPITAEDVNWAALREVSE
jgi:hypothetical protein